MSSDAGIDPTLDPHHELSLQYARDVDLRHPYLSHVFEAQGHAGFGGPAPEVDARAQAMADFITSHSRA